MFLLEGASVFVLILLALVVFTIFLGIKVVPQGFNYTVERFGKYTKTLAPGLGLILPFIDRIGAKQNMMEQVMEVDSQEVITRDNAMVMVDGIAYFQIMNAAKASYEVNDLERAIENLTMTNIRTVMGSMDLDALLAQRDEINHKLLSVVDEAAAPWGVKMTRIEIKDIKPPQDLVDSMANQMKAERDKRATILVAEGERQSAILSAEGDKQAVVLEAEGRREAAFKDAEARERAAQAEAAATAMVSKAIAEGDIQAINYFVANKYIGALEGIATSDNQKLIMMPLEATSMLGAVAGISEIAKQAFDGEPGAAKKPPSKTTPGITSHKGTP
ncbi:MAG TPA: SPFH/Band 7/PHB domain protein [Rhizobiales bacterium]|nr:SPFH/Band 7/PHB domain protein [Hyphomicrobiales bacterium]